MPGNLLSQYGTHGIEYSDWLQKAQQQTGVTNTNDRGQQQKLVDAAMVMWDAKYGGLFNQRTHGENATLPGAKAPPMLTPGELQGGVYKPNPDRDKFIAARAEAIRQFYSLIGKEAPGWGEDLASAIPPRPLSWGSVSPA